MTYCDVKAIKADPGYKNWKLQFENYVSSRDRTPQPINFFLVYDIDDKAFEIKSEYQVTYNQIVLQMAKVPSSKEKNDVDILIQDYEYT